MLQIEEIVGSFGDVGPKIQSHIVSSRFPYTYHHDWYRGKHRDENPKAEMLSRSDVAEIIRELPPEEYAKQVVRGALIYMFENYSKDFLDDILLIENHLEKADIIQTYEKMYKFSLTE